MPDAYQKPGGIETIQTLLLITKTSNRSGEYKRHHMTETCQP